MRAFLRELVLSPDARVSVGLHAYISLILIILFITTRPGNYGPAVRFEVM